MISSSGGVEEKERAGGKGCNCLLEGEEMISGFGSLEIGCVLIWWIFISFSVRNPSTQYSKGHGYGQFSVWVYMWSSRLVEDESSFPHMGQLFTAEEEEEGGSLWGVNSTSEKRDSRGFEVSSEGFACRIAIGSGRCKEFRTFFSSRDGGGEVLIVGVWDLNSKVPEESVGLVVTRGALKTYG